MICLASQPSSIAADSLKSYNELIQTTTNNLETRLESIDKKLEKNTRDSNTDAGEIQLMEKRLSTQNCLEICTRLSSRMNQIQQLREALGIDNPADSVSSSNVPERVADDGLQECKNGFINTVAKLDHHLKKGADVNAQEGDYGAVLYAAAFRGDKVIVQLLVDQGADVNA